MHDRGWFDYVIVGAGSAGCVLANRLTANGDRRVLLLESGPADRNPWLHIPIGFSRTFADPGVNWCYDTAPQPGLGGRSVFWPRGRVLGGSSSINGMVYIRGQPQDFDHWRDLGNPGWGWSQVEPYFVRSEGKVAGVTGNYGSDGPIAISDVPVRNALTQAFIDAAMQTGLPSRTSFNDGDQEGTGFFHITTRGGRRCSAAGAYLAPAAGRPNLVVATGAHVTRIVLDGTRATGVEWVERGERQRVQVNAEVLLCAGAVNSPQILQLSGIGAGGLLQRHGISVGHHLPGVGANLHDHFGARLIARVDRKLSINDAFHSRPHRLAAFVLQYLFTRSGQLAIGGAEAGAFSRSRPSIGRPDLQVHFLPLSSERRGWSFHAFSGITANVCHLRPESRGRVEIASADPFAAPLIDPNYLATENDCATMVAGIRFGRRIFGAPALAAFGTIEARPGAGATTDEAILDYVKADGSTLFHPVGTCRMGYDANAVVDATLRVRGIAGLRIVDAAVMPAITSGNTNAAVTMIAERAADLIAAQS